MSITEVIIDDDLRPVYNQVMVLNHLGMEDTDLDQESDDEIAIQ